MGWGDELMAAGDARKLHKQTGKLVLIVDRLGRPRWSELWQGVPYILRPDQCAQPHVRLRNGPDARPYIAAKSIAQWKWKTYTARPAEVCFTDEELSFAEPYRGAVMIEPEVKATGHRNKAWASQKWASVAIWLQYDGHRVVQCCQPGTAAIGERVETPTFRHALAVLSVARLFIGTEGGLMHGAAAVGTPAVILWSEFIDPSITGYSTMTNLRRATRTCGKRFECPTCRQSMNAITVEDVLSTARRKLHEAA